MKRLFSLFVILLLIPSELIAQCPEIDRSSFAKAIAKTAFTVKADDTTSEQILSLDAYAENSSWQVKGYESGVVTVFVDGKYNQDIFLFNGSTKFKYRVLLGKFNPGVHQLEIVFNQKRSPEKIRSANIISVVVSRDLSLGNSDKVAIENAPFLHARPDTIGKFSDIPLLMYYEILPVENSLERIIYTSIYTNEDGGTRTDALLARWGRITDIEWVYEISHKNGKIVSEAIQGANHITKNFAGSRVFGKHPLIYDVTVNNNFADQGCSPLRTALVPLKANLSKESRETIMDENPWTYRIMAQEAIREGRIDPENLGENTIADLRDYVFAEVFNGSRESAISIEAIGSDGQTFTSDGGNRLMRVDRSGYARVALRFPRSLRNRKNNFSVVCHLKSGERAVCSDVNLIKIVSLNKKFAPVDHPAVEKEAQQNSGKKVEFYVKLK